ncbi:MAG: tetratricopeptide repeat protein [Chloroflexota bacterium]
MTSLAHLTPSERRPFILFLLSLLILAGVLLGRFVNSRLTDTAVIANGPAPSPLQMSAEAYIQQLQEKLANNPENPSLYSQLGLAYLQRVRETADATLYTQADWAFTQALDREPELLDAIIGRGALALARHDFQGALGWGEKARAINPFRAEILGILVDAQVELGRYEEAVATGQAMVDLRPDLTSYSRVSYLRELHGETAGAIEAMQAAVDAGVPGTEGTLWTTVQLGNLYFNSGDWAAAEALYQQAIQFKADYAYALAGMARVQAAGGDYEAAIAIYEPLVIRLPLPEFVIALGELYEVTGQMDKAKDQYDLVRAIQQLNASAGVDVDLELALFDADHGADPAQALVKARAAYQRRPSLYAADVLAWTLYQNGQYEEAQQYSQQALRLGTRDATLHYHAGMIAYALGNRDQARAHLQEALAINPAFSVRYAPLAQALLADL